MRSVQVVPDGRRLGALVELLAQGVLTDPRDRAVCRSSKVAPR